MATMYYRPYTTEPVKEGQSDKMPAHSAMDTILPEYQYIFMDPSGPGTSRGKELAKPKPITQGDDLDATQFGLLDHQMNEMDRYRLAVQKMGQDILALRQQIRDSELSNSTLKRELLHYNDAAKYFLDSSDLDGLSKAELAARYISLKQTLSSQTTELAHYKERTQKLQNELIKKNDKEKEYIKLSQAHKAQQDLLHRLQDHTQKEKKMKEAFKKQEEVIQKMEGMLNKQQGTSSPGKEHKKDAAYEALLAENKRLRTQLDDERDEARRKKGSREDDDERLELYQNLDKAEGRIMSLEKQLADNARKWGKEKNDLLVRLSETEHGLGRSNTSGLQDYSGMDQEPRRYSKAPKGKKPRAKLKPIEY